MEIQKEPMENMDLNFWRNKKVFITGHTGFKGSWACLIFQKLGCEVQGYSLKPDTKYNAYDIFKINEFIKSELKDIRDFDSIKSSIINFKPDIIFHFAAKPLVRYSYSNPIDTYTTNVIGLMNLLEASKNLKNECFILNVTSDKCYFNDNNNQKSFSENDKLGGNDIYSSSKACSEILSHSFQFSFFKNTNIGMATARAGNIIGGGDWSQDRIVTDIVNSIYIKKDRLKVRYPKSVRPWQHVLDPLRGYFMLVENLYKKPSLHGSSFNFGPDPSKKINVQDFLKIYNKYLNHKLKFSIDSSETFHEDNEISLNTDKANKLLNWRPLLSQEESIQQTAIWYENYYNNTDILEFSKKLIGNFF